MEYSGSLTNADTLGKNVLYCPYKILRHCYIFKYNNSRDHATDTAIADHSRLCLLKYVRL